jgi:ERCC4-type nuclease
MKLKIDLREKRLIKLIQAFKNQFDFKKIDIEIENLPVGDVIICDDNGNEKLIVERKSLNDLASSIKDGRYVEQSHRLMNNPVHNHNIIYLIEGNLSNWVNKYKVQANTLYSAIFSLNYYKGFSVIKTHDITETAEYILRMCDKLNREKKKVSYYEAGEKKPKKYCEVVKKVKKDNITPENIGEIILSQIPGVSSHTSQVIMNKYGSLYNLLCDLDTNQKCLDDLSYTTENGVIRRISKTSIRNIVQYLLYQKSNIIVINTN